jgi:hypothetical protein
MHGIVAPIGDFCEHDRRGISRVTQQVLAPEEELCSTQLVVVMQFTNISTGLNYEKWAYKADHSGRTV